MGFWSKWSPEAIAVGGSLERRTYTSIYRARLFDEQVHLITGGGTGIGRCIAHELASLGATVVIAGRRPEPLAATVAEIDEAGGSAFALPLNIRDREAVDAAVALRALKHPKQFLSASVIQMSMLPQCLMVQTWDLVVEIHRRLPH